MAFGGNLPFDSTSYTTALAGMNLGDVFFDARCRKFRLYALSNSLTSSTLTTGDVCYIADTSVTYPTGQAGKYTVTNTKANALGGNNDYACFAGIAMGTIAQAASAAAADNRFVLLLVEGSATVTMVDSTAVAGDYLIHSGNGTADKVLQNDTTNQTSALLAKKIGRCIVAASSGSCTGYIMDRFRGI